jgi:hypothetical protein
MNKKSEETASLIKVEMQGTWESYTNLDMNGKGDVMTIKDWRDSYTLDTLKQMCVQMNFSAFSVSAGDPDLFKHVAFKKFPFELKKEHLRPHTDSEIDVNVIHIYRALTPFVEKIPGTWSVHENMDLFGHFNSV